MTPRALEDLLLVTRREPGLLVEVLVRLLVEWPRAWRRRRNRPVVAIARVRAGWRARLLAGWRMVYANPLPICRRGHVLEDRRSDSSWCRTCETEERAAREQCDVCRTCRATWRIRLRESGVPIHLCDVCHSRYGRSPTPVISERLPPPPTAIPSGGVPCSR